MASPNGTSGSIVPAPTREEAAAIVAAVERFMRTTAPRGPGREQAPDAWREVALREGVEHWSDENLADPWINP